LPKALGARLGFVIAAVTAERYSVVRKSASSLCSSSLCAIFSSGYWKMSVSMLEMRKLRMDDLRQPSAKPSFLV
jgi:hypothetical protein